MEQQTLKLNEIHFNGSDALVTFILSNIIQNFEGYHLNQYIEAIIFAFKQNIFHELDFTYTLLLP